MKLRAALLAVGISLAITLPSKADWFDGFVGTTSTLLDVSLSDLLNDGYKVISENSGQWIIANADGKHAVCRVIIETELEPFGGDIKKAFPDATAISQCHQLN